MERHQPAVPIKNGVTHALVLDSVIQARVELTMVFKWDVPLIPPKNAPKKLALSMAPTVRQIAIAIHSGVQIGLGRILGNIVQVHLGNTAGLTHTQPQAWVCTATETLGRT